MLLASKFFKWPVRVHLERCNLPLQLRLFSLNPLFYLLLKLGQLLAGRIEAARMSISGLNQVIDESFQALLAFYLARQARLDIVDGLFSVLPFDLQLFVHHGLQLLHRILRFSQELVHFCSLVLLKLTLGLRAILE